MAKITNKIHINGYDVLKNEFRISFKLADITADHLSFVSTYTYPGRYGFAGSGEQELEMLGLDADHIQQIVEEIFNWMEKPRKALGGLSHGYTMRSRFDATKRLEAERRGKVAVERIIAEAHPLDWAMSALDELEAAITDNGKDDVAWAHFSFAGPVTDDSILAAADAFRQINDGRSIKIDTFDDVATKGRIAAMEATGLGEDASPVPSPLHPVLAEKLAKMKTDHELLWHVQAAKTLPEPSDLEDLLYKLEDLASERPKLSTWHERETHPDYHDTCDKLDDARQAILDHVEAAKQAPAPIVVPVSFPTEAIDKAVNAIHKQVRRFMAPASMREHDFLRSIIQEEIEKVVRGVLL